MTDIRKHHLEYGTCIDFVTGEMLVDTDDERFRQKLAHLLVEEKGFGKPEIQVRRKIETLFAKQFVVSTIDFVVWHHGKAFMVVRYGPGSIVTRERPAVAAARVLLPDYRIPLAVATNGIGAELLDTLTRKVLGEGLESIPTRAQATEFFASLNFAPLAPDRRERELRILNAYDVEICCAGGPCALPGAPEG